VDPWMYTYGSGQPYNTLLIVKRKQQPIKACITEGEEDKTASINEKTKYVSLNVSHTASIFEVDTLPLIDMIIELLLLR